MIGGNQSLFVCGRGDLDISENTTLHNDESIGLAQLQQFHRVVSELCGEHTISCGWGSASLDMSEHNIA